MKRVAQFFGKKVVRNAAIVLAIALVAYVVMYGVREGFQTDNTVLTEYINVADTTSANKTGVTGNTFQLQKFPKLHKRLVDFKVSFYTPAKQNTSLTTCDVPVPSGNKYTTLSTFGQSTNDIYLEAKDKKNVTVNIYGPNFKRPKNAPVDNVRILGSSKPVGTPEGPPSADDIMGGIKVKNLKINTVGLHGPVRSAKNCFITDTQRINDTDVKVDTRLDFTFV